MKLIPAKMEHVFAIYELVQETIKEVYSKYYAPGVVEFFCNHHAVQKIIDDVTNGRTYVVVEDYEVMGTGTIDENHITRVFVKPKHQNKGIGTMIFEAFEKIIFENFDTIQLDSSLAAINMYIKRGYKPICHETTDCENGSILVYEVMEKKK